MYVPNLNKKEYYDVYFKVFTLAFRATVAA